MVEIELANLKKVTINEFKGRKLLDIRNYFEKDGEQRPTQKGISLTPEQWLKLLHNKDEISKALGIDPSIDFGDDDDEGDARALAKREIEPGAGEQESKKAKIEAGAKETEPETKPVAQLEPSPVKKQKKLSSDTVDPEDLAQDIKEEE